jgi:stalled ribosome rescue protein Dom34
MIKPYIGTLNEKIMKEQHQPQLAGVWMDHHHAQFIVPVDGEFSFGTKVDSGEYHGDKGEHAAMNAEKADARKYYKTIAHNLMNYDEIYLFGPGKSQEELRNFLHEDSHFKNKRIAVGSASICPITRWWPK